jgi:hypothetical protein
MAVGVVAGVATTAAVAAGAVVGVAVGVATTATVSVGASVGVSLAAVVLVGVTVPVKERHPANAPAIAASLSNSRLEIPRGRGLSLQLRFLVIGPLSL